MGFTALIVDDESQARITLSHFVKQYLSEIDRIEEAASVAEANRLIQSCEPALIFLDIDLGSESGFDLLDAHPNPSFSVIFVTGHSSFALKAFRYAALDYLVKPIVPENLVEAFGRLQRHPLKDRHLRIKGLQQSWHAQRLDILTVSTTDAYIPIEIEQIVSIQGSGNYAVIRMRNGRKETVCKSIGEFEELLPNDRFMRVHQSWIINMRWVDRYAKRDGVIVMTDQSEIVLARRRKEDFLKLLHL